MSTMRKKAASVDQVAVEGGQWPKLAVKNFGPITEGEVELRPLTVFAGPSNTGKSWLATLIYAMMRDVAGDYGLSGIPSGLLDSGEDGLENFPENPIMWLQCLRKDKVLRLTDGDKKVLKSVLESGQHGREQELLRCFGLADISDLVRKSGTGDANITFMNAVVPDAVATQQCLKINRKGDFSLCADTRTDAYQPPSERFLDTLKLLLDPDTDNDQGRSKSRNVRAELLGLVTNNHWYPSIHYLPADRGSIMHTLRTIIGALIQGASRAGLTHRSPLPTLSGVLGDFLEQLIALPDRGPRRGDPATETADSLEQNVLGGKIQVKKSEVDYPYFTYRPHGWKQDLSLMSVSSMVSELAPVALYLRHCVGKGDLLILEEPEAHLHPAMQVRLVQEIAGWVRQGIRVLITTHSEWVLEEITNIVAAGEGKKECGIPKQDVGMWLFEPKGKRSPGSTVREIDWSVDEGGFALDFDDVAIELHNEWASFVRDVE